MAKSFASGNMKYNLFTRLIICVFFLLLLLTAADTQSGGPRPLLAQSASAAQRSPN